MTDPLIAAWHQRLACKCCGKAEVSPRLISALRLLERSLGRSLTINSGYRCPKHNSDVGGAPKSTHMLGLAVDVAVRDAEDAELLTDRAKTFGFTGIGYGDAFVHLDLRLEPLEWRYGRDGRPIYKHRGTV